MHLLLLSNSRDPAGNYLLHPRAELAELLAGVGEVVFVPYASVTATYDSYAIKLRDALAPLGCGVRSVHETDDPVALVRDAAAIAVGGGNTFRLLERLYATRLLDVVRERARAGVPYLGWSAGSVVACPTIQTTNDMPIIAPPSFAALGLVPFQINAHYTDFHPPGFQGETRAERLAEFLALNASQRVIGLREGAMLRVIDDVATLLGAPGAVEFRSGSAPRELTVGSPV